MNTETAGAPGRLRVHVMACLEGLFWAALVLVTLAVHYGANTAGPEFRYVDF